MQSSLERLLMESLTDMESFISKIKIFFKALSWMEDAKEKVDLSNLMEATMMAILKIMLQTVMEFMLAKKGLDMKGNGKIMCLMVRDRQLTLMDRGILANF